MNAGFSSRRIVWRWQNKQDRETPVDAALILDSIREGVYWVDCDGKVVEANPACASLLGRPLDQLVGADAHDLMHHSDERGRPLARRGCPLHCCEAPEFHRSTTDVFWHADGTSFAVDCTSSPVRLDGETVGRVCVFQDVSQQKAVESRLRAEATEQTAVAALGRRALIDGASPELFQDATDQLQDLLGVAYSKVLEYHESQNELLVRAGSGLPSDVVGEAKIGADIGTHAGYALHTGETVVVSEIDIEKRFPGSVLLHRLGAASGICAVIETVDGTYGLVTAHDTKARVYARHEIALVETVANLLAAAINRGRAEQLEAALQDTRRLQALGELAGGVAHDFNNLLAVIENYAALAAQDRRRKLEFDRDIDGILEAARQGADLTAQLHQFARQEQNDSELVDVREPIEKAASLLSDAFPRDIEISVRLPGEPLEARVQPTDLHRCLVNLAINARDAMEVGGGLIEISAKEVYVDARRAGRSGADAGAFVRISVRDTGTGMSEEVLARALDPFFTTKGANGSGLGLATVYAVAARSSGFVEIQSAEGEGTTVAVHLSAGA
jgi:PAS domain S-box-containing protein